MTRICTKIEKFEVNFNYNYLNPAALSKKPNIIQRNRSWFQQIFLKFDQKSVQKSQNSKLISTKFTRNAAPLPKKPNVIQNNRSWFQQNFLKFYKYLYKNPKIRSYFQLKLLKCSSSIKKTLHNPEKSKLVSTKIFII